MRSIRCVSAILLTIILVVGVVPGREQEKKKRIATISHLMKGLIHPGLRSLQKLAKEEPTTRRNMDAVQMHAAVLNEAAILLTDDDKSQGADWDRAAQKMQTATAVLFEKAKARDDKGVASALKELSTSCIQCHAEFRNN